ncbi:hypothetical protein LIER_09024 [Lithospermum erythrorhizon]|uniref:Uncharacterized protein n=1 Tax=Lithospermum erythrorhizon TaxID=34254 RepID=A0AAV3PII8_LITER
MKSNNLEGYEAMPNSTVRIKQHEQKFERIYVCSGSLKEGFRAGCRRLLCLDGCFFKGAFRGQILATIGEDRDNVSTPLLGKL